MRNYDPEKKSFVFYKQWNKSISRLNAEQKAELLDAIMAYQCSDEVPEPEDVSVAILFDCMCEVFDQNENNYKKKGGQYGNKNACKNESKTNKTNKNESENESKTNTDKNGDTVTVTDTVTDTANVTVTEKATETETVKARNNARAKQARETARAAVAYLNEKAGTNYAPDTKETVRLVQARLSDGYGIEDFYAVIDKKTAEWLHDAKMCAYLRPSTLFCGRFEEYLHQKARAPDSRQALIDQYAREAFEEESNDTG